MSSLGGALRPPSSPGPVRRVLRGIGDVAVTPLLAGWQLLGLTTGLLVQALRPGTWRRTVRSELIRHLGEMAVAALPALLVAAALVGLGLVLQALYWLRLFGQTDAIGNLLVLVLVRELGPLIVATLLVGRSLTAMVSELHELVRTGGLRALDAMGVDPFHFLVVPRVAAMAIACACLNVLFLTTTLLVGHLSASAAGLAREPLTHFFAGVLSVMGPGELGISVLKPVLFGFFIALVACNLSLRVGSRDRSLRQLLPRGFTAAMAGVLAISVLLSALL